MMTHCDHYEAHSILKLLLHFHFKFANYLCHTILHEYYITNCCMLILLQSIDIYSITHHIRCVETQVKGVSPCLSFPLCHTLKLPLAGAHLHPFAHALRCLLFLVRAVREQPL